MRAETNFKVDYIAALARLDISEDEAARYQEQLDGIISYIEELGQVDVDGVEPTAHPAPVLDRLRELRLADENIYLRSGSLNIINGMVGLVFSCDGSHYIGYQDFIRHREDVYG